MGFVLDEIVAAAEGNGATIRVIGSLAFRKAAEQANPHLLADEKG